MDDYVSRNAIIQMFNTTDRYVADSLRLCDTDKQFPQNEVFIVDDMYEGLEQLPSAQPEPKHGEWIPIRKGERGYSAGDFRCSVCHQPNKCYIVTNYCSHCGALMRDK